MKAEKVEKDWTELRAKIKQRWNKLTDEDIESAKDQMEKITGKVQKTYGLAKKQARKDFEDFKNALVSSKRIMHNHKDAVIPF